MTESAESVPPWARPVRTGGLFRCCLGSIEEMAVSVPNVEGTKVRCKYCDAAIWFHRGAWEWDQKGEDV